MFRRHKARLLLHSKNECLLPYPLVCSSSLLFFLFLESVFGHKVSSIVVPPRFALFKRNCTNHVSMKLRKEVLFYCK